MTHTTYREIEALIFQFKAKLIKFDRWPGRFDFLRQDTVTMLNTTPAIRSGRLPDFSSH